MAAIKITGFDPDRYEKPDPEPSSRPIRRRTESERPAPGPAPREVRKAVDAATAEHLRIKYGMQNVKFSELAPKKSSGAKNQKASELGKGTTAKLTGRPDRKDASPAKSEEPPDEGASSDDGG